MCLAKVSSGQTGFGLCLEKLHGGMALLWGWEDLSLLWPCFQGLWILGAGLSAHMMWREEQGCSHTGVQGQPHQILKDGHEPWSLSSPCMASAMHISEVSSPWHVCDTQHHSGK